MIYRLATPSAATLASLATLLLCRQVQAADDVHIWVRAFIPDSTAGVVNIADSSSGNAARMVVRASDGGCISTDRRGWSNALTTSSRLSSDVHLVLDAINPPEVRASTGKKMHVAAAVHTLDCQSGAELAMKPAQLVAENVEAPKLTDSKAQFSLLAASADPLRPWSSSTINYEATFSYDSQTRLLEFHAVVAAFPAYEAYATLNGGPVFTVFRAGPLPANAAGSPDASSMEIQGSVDLTDPGKRPRAPTGLTVQ